MKYCDYIDMFSMGMVACVNVRDFFFFFQAEDGIRDLTVTGVQTCALPIFKKLHQEERIVLYPNAADEDLIYLYKHAEALVHPSLSEGFGLPIIEARQFGTEIGRASCRERV